MAVGLHRGSSDGRVFGLAMGGCPELAGPLTCSPSQGMLAPRSSHTALIPAHIGVLVIEICSQSRT